jgi:hypothetical protein
MEKKIKFTLTAYEDGTYEMVYPDQAATALDTTNDPASGDSDIETPPKPPGNP